MKNRAIIRDAQLVANLLADPTYQKVIGDVIERQAAIMKAPTSTTEELIEAHAIVRALDAIDNYTRGLHGLAVVEDRKKE